MYPFEYCNPTKIVFGEDTVKSAGEQLASYGMNNILLVYGMSSIKKNGVYDAVTASFEAAGIKWTEWSGVKPNPLRSHVQAGIELGRKTGINGIFAVGGGSVIDEAKAIAAGIPADCDFWDFYTDVANSASNAISHTIESYLTRPDGFMPVQDGYAVGVVKAIMISTEKILDVTEEDDAAACKEGIQKFRAWLSKIGNPVSLRECNIQKDQIPELARHSEILAKAWGTGAVYS